MIGNKTLPGTFTTAIILNDLKWTLQQTQAKIYTKGNRNATNVYPLFTGDATTTYPHSWLVKPVTHTCIINIAFKDGMLLLLF